MDSCGRGIFGGRDHHWNYWMDIVECPHRTAQMVEEQQRLEEASGEISRLASKSREEILALLGEGAAPNANGEAISKLRNRVTQQLNLTRDATLEEMLQKAKLSVGDLELLWERADVWKSHYSVVLQDINHQRTLQGVRDVLSSLGAIVETLEGKRRLTEAIQLRRWRAAKEGESSKIAEEILKNQVNQKTQALREVRNELADVSRFVEMLATEQHADNLTDIKDNKLKPGLERLTGSFTALNFTDSASGPSTADRVKQLYVALFGKGFSIEESHQTILVGEEGLYSLRKKILGLRDERESLRAELRGVFQQIEKVDGEFSRLTHAKATNLAKRWKNVSLVCVTAPSWSEALLL